MPAIVTAKKYRPLEELKQQYGALWPQFEADAKLGEYDARRLNFGCGDSQYKEFLNVDNNAVCKPDEFWPDDGCGFRCADESVDFVYSTHVVEHLDDLVLFFNEAHRVLRPGCAMWTRAPYYSSIRCWQDPTHKRAISENTFAYTEKEWRDEQRLSHYPITANFANTFAFSWHEEWNFKNPTPEQEEARKKALKSQINVASDIIVRSVKL